MMEKEIISERIVGEKIKWVLGKVREREFVSVCDLVW